MAARRMLIPMGAPQRHESVSRGTDGTAGTGGGAPANPHVPAAAPIPGAWRPEPWREPNLTILTRLAESHPGWRVIEVDGGWKATRDGTEMVTARSLAGLEQKILGLERSR